MMKDESILNVLMYLFKNRMQESGALDVERKKLLVQLEEMGFHRLVINQALEWLNNLSDKNHEPMRVSQKSSFRVFSDYECEVLNIECRRLLIVLEQQGILSPYLRELIINQALELSTEEIEVSLLKWVILMVLFNQSDEKQALASMELLILADPIGGMQ